MEQTKIRLDDKYSYFIENVYDFFELWCNSAYDSFIFILGINIDIENEDAYGYYDFENYVFDELNKLYIENKSIDTSLSSFRYSQDNLPVDKFLDETINMCITNYLSRHRLISQKFTKAITNLVDFEMLLNSKHSLTKYSSEEFKESCEKNKLIDAYIENALKDVSRKRIDVLNKMREIYIENIKLISEYPIKHEGLIKLEEELDSIQKEADETVLKELNKIVTINLDICK